MKTSKKKPAQKAKRTAVVLSAIAVVVLIVVSVLIVVPEWKLRAKRRDADIASAALSHGADRIHFLNTGSSDAILLESGGHFALVDAGEDSDNPRGFDALELTGYEDKVLDYLKQHAASADGKVHLDFVLGTHSHSDHIGGFDTILADDAIEVGRAYLKVYDSSKIKDSEVEKWDNQEVYDQMVDALKAKNVPIISEPGSEPFTLGNYTITLWNTVDEETGKKVGENDQSMGVLVEKDGTKVFLAGDMDNINGDEARLAEQIGEVDLLKVGHHGYPLSSSAPWLRTLSPEYCVVTNNRNIKNVIILWRIIRCADSTIFTTNEENGILAEIGSSGNITFYNCIHA